VLKKISEAKQKAAKEASEAADREVERRAAQAVREMEEQYRAGGCCTIS
jgi:vacuolar-type H+-ATPase subunit E/Vma4